MRAQVVDGDKTGAPEGRAAGQVRGPSAQACALNDALGETLNAVGDLPKTRGKTARIRVGLAIAVIAAGLIMAANLWIGS